MDIENIVASDYILSTSREYSLYVCESRSIPQVADGLKDAQRKAIWVIRNKADKIKTISLSGEMISSGLYLHGDTSASATISQLAAPYNNNVTFLEGIGNFGCLIASTDWGAPRYTFVKKNKATAELILTDSDIIPTIENYDGSTMQPKHFLPLIPLVLLNKISGIAVGWSTEILPHKLNDIIDSCVDVLDGKPQKELEPFFNHFNLKIYKENNQWIVEGEVIIEDTSTIRVTELPPDLSIDKFKDRLNKFEEDGKINSYIDKTSKNIDIRIKMPRGSVKDWTRDDAILFFKLKQKLNQRLVVISLKGDSIKQYDTTQELIEEFTNWRLTWYQQRYEYIKQNILIEVQYWTALKLCFDTNLPQRISKLNNKAELKDLIRIMLNSLNPQDTLIEKITNIPIYRWTLEQYNEILNKISELNDQLTETQDILDDPKKQKKIYRSELLELKKKKLM